MALLCHIFGDRIDRHVEPIIKMPVDCKDIISLGVFSDRFNLEKLLQHLPQRDIVGRNIPFTTMELVAVQPGAVAAMLSLVYRAVSPRRARSQSAGAEKGYRY
jgi:hypothetical protein